MTGSASVQFNQLERLVGGEPLRPTSDDLGQGGDGARRNEWWGLVQAGYGGAQSPRQRRRETLLYGSANKRPFARRIGACTRAHRSTFGGFTQTGKRKFFV